LREAHPREDRVHRRDSLSVGLPVRDVDAARDVADVFADDVVMAHQLDPRRVSFLDGMQLRLLEVAIDPEGIRVDDRDLVPSDRRIVAEPRLQVRHPAVHRRPDVRPLERSGCRQPRASVHRHRP